MTEYELDISIDESALDVEWLRQPELMGKYTKIQAKAQRNYDLIAEELKSLRADLDKSIRKNPEKYKIDKLTEGSVDSAIRSRSSYKQKKTELIEAQYEWNTANGMVSAFHQKKASLENEVKLFGMDYFAGPFVPRDLVSERKKKNEIALTVKIKRKKKKKK